MKIVSLETTPVSVPYRQAERSFRVQRGGVSDVIVQRVTATGTLLLSSASHVTLRENTLSPVNAE